MDPPSPQAVERKGNDAVATSDGDDGKNSCVVVEVSIVEGVKVAMGEAGEVSSGSQSSDGEVLLGVHEEATVGTIRGGLSHNDGVDLVKGVDAWTVSEGSVKKTSYSEAVRDDLSETLQPDFVVKNGVADVSIPEELMVDVDPLWKYFVVGYFMNDVPHIGSIHSTGRRRSGAE
ncbi:hypothetical protein F2Q69_00004994 [Brassica cretica]|uniref:Uncharacterized protein n=1 Tax=Brassica cretica TaxID=69181 RepID=A0A8S9P083_BRACR|nr:hypothetical protein F2Q69_00004994 [Brassica cretica]